MILQIDFGDWERLRAAASVNQVWAALGNDQFCELLWLAREVGVNLPKNYKEYKFTHPEPVAEWQTFRGFLAEVDTTVHLLNRLLAEQDFEMAPWDSPAGKGEPLRSRLSEMDKLASVIVACKEISASSLRTKIARYFESQLRKRPGTWTDAERSLWRFLPAT